MPTAWSRRRLIAAVGAGLASARMAAAQGLETRRPLTADPFALGVASGEPASDGFVIWTRLVGPAAARLDAPALPVAYEVAEDEGFRRVVRAGRVPATPALAHSVHIEIHGLRPGRPYWYRFHAAGAVSPTGRAATVPARADRARIALTSCQHYEAGWFAAYRDMAAAQPDFVLQVGDYIYETPTGLKSVRKFDAPEPKDLDGYRRRYAIYKTDPDLQAAHAAAPWVVTWDDHEVQNDYADLNNLDALPPAAFAPRRAAAYQAYFEHMPLRPSLWNAAGGPRMYRTLAWGDLFTMPILDGRQYRSNQACNPRFKSGNHAETACSEIDDPSRTMLGPAQEAWFARQMASETRPWTVVAQQTVVAPLDLDGGSMMDQWDGYGAARRKLLAGLGAPAVRNPVVLSGDIHSFWVNDLKAAPKDPTLATEVVTTCLSGSLAPKARYVGVRDRNPHVRFVDMANYGYPLLDIGRKAMTVDLRGLPDQTDPNGQARSLARFVVDDRRPGAQTA